MLSSAPVSSIISPRARAVLALALVALLAAPVTARATERETISAIDNVFDPGVVRVPAGGTVIWTNDGNSPHTVTADDGRFDSGNLAPGQAFTLTFPTPGVYAYHCRYHGGPGGVGMAGVVLVGDVSLPGAAPGVGPGREAPPTVPGPTVRVPQDFPTIQQAVDAAQPGGLVLVSPGVYNEAVTVTTQFLTIRGIDRNRVILEGGFQLPNGIHVIEADGVSIENMTGTTC